MKLTAEMMGSIIPYLMPEVSIDEVRGKLQNAVSDIGSSTIFDDDDLREIERMIPNELLDQVLCQNPLHQVYFRAGLLACREYMAKFVEQGGDATTAASIRANWWPQLGPDPGKPRAYRFEELAEEYERPDGTPGWKALPLDPSTEGLVRAWDFLGRPAPDAEPSDV